MKLKARGAAKRNNNGGDDDDDDDDDDDMIMMMMMMMMMMVMVVMVMMMMMMIKKIFYKSFSDIGCSNRNEFRCMGTCGEKTTGTHKCKPLPVISVMLFMIEIWRLLL